VWVLIIFIRSATFYPDHGGNPIPGVVSINPDGTTTFIPHIPSDIPAVGSSSKGTLQVAPEAPGGTPVVKHGDLTTTEPGKALFKEDSAETENGRRWLSYLKTVISSD